MSKHGIFSRNSGSRQIKILKEFAKENRREMTIAEKILWEGIRNKKTGYKFRKQHPIGDYIADFICIEKKPVIEVDGGYHNT